MAVPKNKELYAKVKKEAKKKFVKYPSIYANSWIVNEYKKRGGVYVGSKPKSTGLKRWYKEKWVDLNRPIKKNGKIVGYKSCGRKSVNSKEKYPLCRPTYVITKKSPKTYKELSKRSISKAKKQKSKIRHTGNVQFGGGVWMNKFNDYKDKVMIKANKQMDELKSTLKTKIKEVQNKTQIGGGLKDKLIKLGEQQFKKQQEKLIKGLEQKLEQKIDSYIDKGQLGGGMFDKFKEYSKEKLKDMKIKGEQKLQEIKAQSEKKLEELKAQGKEKFQELKTQSEKKLEELQAQGKEKFEELKTQGIQKLNDLENKLDQKVGGSNCGAYGSRKMSGGKAQYHGKRSQVMVPVPKNVKKWAKYAFKLKDLGFKGATTTGWKRARQLATQDSIPIEDLKYMHAWYSRHIYTSYPGFNKWIKEGRPKTKEWMNKRSIIAIVTWGGPAALKWLNSKKVLSLLSKHFDKEYHEIKKKHK